MNNDKLEWEEQLKAKPFSNNHFTPQMSKHVEDHVQIQTPSFKRWKIFAATLPLVAGVLFVGFHTWDRAPEEQPLTQAVNLKDVPSSEEVEVIKFPGTNGEEVKIPLQITKAELSLDSDDSVRVTDTPSFNLVEMSYRIPPEMKDKLQAVLVYRPDMIGGYLLLAPAGWQTSAIVGANGSYGVTLSNPGNKEETLVFSDSAGSCQGCAVNSIGTYFPDKAKWADQRGFTVYDPLTFAEWSQPGTTGPDARTAVYTTDSEEGYFKNGAVYYEKNDGENWYLFRQLEFKLSQESLPDDSYDTVIDFFKAHHGAMIVATANVESITNDIPKKMDPGTILTYRLNEESKLTFDLEYDKGPSGSEQSNVHNENADIEGRAAEDAYIDSIKKSVKDLPVIDLGYDLPAPAPGVVVMYGSDGYINRVYTEDD